MVGGGGALRRRLCLAVLLGCCAALCAAGKATKKGAKAKASKGGTVDKTTLGYAAVTVRRTLRPFQCESVRQVLGIFTFFGVVYSFAITAFDTEPQPYEHLAVKNYKQKASTAQGVAKVD